MEVTNETKITITRIELICLQTCMTLINEATYKEVEGAAMEDYVVAKMRLKDLIKKISADMAGLKLSSSSKKTSGLKKKVTRKKK